MRAQTPVAFGMIFASLMLCQAGCKNTKAPEEESRLSKLAVFYGRFIGQNKGKSPASEQELKAYIQTIDPNLNLDELFVSPRDKEPYVVLYRTRVAKPGAKVVTAHEKTGVDGKKLVSLSTGQVISADDEELSKMLADAPAK